MYDDLISWLHRMAALSAHCEKIESCEMCDATEACAEFKLADIYENAEKTADAIEKLSRKIQFAALPDDAVIYVTIYGSDISKNKVISVIKKELFLSKDWESFVFVWGWPGPDYNCYYFKDYGRTWAFDLKDFSGPYHFTLHGCLCSQS